MGKQEVVNYVMNSPYNSNKAVLESLLEDLENNSSLEEYFLEYDEEQAEGYVITLPNIYENGTLIYEKRFFLIHYPEEDGGAVNPAFIFENEEEDCLQLFSLEGIYFNLEDISQDKYIMTYKGQWFPPSSGEGTIIPVQFTWSSLGTSQIILPAAYGQNAIKLVSLSAEGEQTITSYINSKWSGGIQIFINNYPSNKELYVQYMINNELKGEQEIIQRFNYIYPLDYFSDETPLEMQELLINFYFKESDK